MRRVLQTTTDITIAILFVLLLLTIGIGVSRADDAPTDSYLRVLPEDDVAYTYDLFSIRLESRLRIGNATNGTWVANTNEIEFVVEDLSQDLVIHRETVRLLNGSLTRELLVTPEWTTSRVRASAYDKVAGLLAVAEFTTHFSEPYLQDLIWGNLREIRGREEARTDRAIAEGRAMMIVVIVSAVTVTAILAVRREHKLCVRVNQTSSWDRFSRWAFWWSYPTNDLYVWLDADHTWAPEVAAQFNAGRRSGWLAALQDERAMLEKEIARVQAGAVA